MKVLWVCNTIFGSVAEHFGERKTNAGGWQLGLFCAMQEEKAIEIGICFPTNKKTVIKKCIEGVSYYSFYQKQGFLGMSDTVSFNKITENNLKEIIEDFSPDILQVFGTEYPHCLQAVRAFNNSQKTIVHLQGILTEIAKNYYAGIPKRYIRMWVPSAIIRGTIKQQKEIMEKRAGTERRILSIVNNVIGRTTFDKDSVLRINPDINYYRCNELLRKCFYDGEWDYEKCERNTIFVSQASYPIKGIHKLFLALPEIRKKIPGVKVYVAGNNPVKDSSIKGRLAISSYGVYLKELLFSLELSDCVFFLGNLNENEMKQRMLKSNLFVLPSANENSSNSLGEAMLLGLPCVVSQTGGTPSIISEQEGKLYHFENSRMLAEEIISLLTDADEQKKLSHAAKKRALNTHDYKKVVRDMRVIYESII